MKHDREERKRKKVIIIFSAFIVFSMVVSIFAIVVDRFQTNDELSYDSYNFKVTNTGYRVKINGDYLDFQYFPSDLERINLSKEIFERLNNSKGIILVFNPNESVDNLQYIDFARFDISNQLKNPIGFAITEPSSLYSSVPVLGCQNSSVEVPFIMFNISSSSDFELDRNYPNCIILNAKLKDIVALKDRLVYGMLGVMKD